MTKVVIVYECDRCGAEIPGRIGHLSWTHTDRDGGEQTDTNAFGGMHFCESCMEEIGAFIAGNRIPMPVMDRPAAPAELPAKTETINVDARNMVIGHTETHDEPIPIQDHLAAHAYTAQITQVVEESPAEAAQESDQPAESAPAKTDQLPAADKQRVYEPVTVKKSCGRRIDVDWDKAEALYKAGWPCREIITEKEFKGKLTEKQIYQHMYHAGLVTKRAQAAAKKGEGAHEAG